VFKQSLAEIGRIDKIRLGKIRTLTWGAAFYAPGNPNSG
jgi:hypothetical protein